MVSILNLKTAKKIFILNKWIWFANLVIVAIWKKTDFDELSLIKDSVLNVAKIFVLNNKKE